LKEQAKPKPVAAVYKTIYGETYYGCYKDSGNRDLPKLLGAGYGDPRKCFKMAMDGGFKYVGMKYAGECWVGNTVGKYGKRPDSECNMPCKKDSTRTCGAGWRKSVFELKVAPKVESTVIHNVDGNVRQEITATRHSDHRMGLSYLGCFKDNASRDMSWVTSNGTPEGCFKNVRDKGYEFAALQYGGQCFGSNKVGRYGDRPDKECNKECNTEKGMMCGGGWRNSVWFTGGVSYEKSINHCISASGKDLQQTRYNNVELKDCMEACTNSAKCSAVEYYPKGWQGTRCFHINQGFGDNRAVKGKPGRQWRDAECYVRVGKYGK
jgi:hypothetical protein